MIKNLNILLRYAMPKIYQKSSLIFLRKLQQMTLSNRIWRNHHFLNHSQHKVNYNRILSRRLADTVGPKLTDIIKKITENVNEKMVQDVQAVFQFEVKELGTFYIDLKNGKGSAGEGKPASKPDAILTTDVKNLLALFSGKLKPKMAVMMGKLKVGGSPVQALKLEKVLPKLRGEEA